MRADTRPASNSAGPDRVQPEQGVSGFQCLDNETSGIELLHIYCGYMVKCW